MKKIFKAFVFVMILGAFPHSMRASENTVTRADFLAESVHTFLGDELKMTDEENCFPDTHAHQFEKEICYAKSKGIIQGHLDGTFRPNTSVNVAEALKVLVNTIGIKQVKQTVHSNEKEMWDSVFRKLAEERSWLSGTTLTREHELNRVETRVLLAKANEWLKAELKRYDSVTEEERALLGTGKWEDGWWVLYYRYTDQSEAKFTPITLRKNNGLILFPGYREHESLASNHVVTVAVGADTKEDSIPVAIGSFHQIGMTDAGNRVGTVARQAALRQYRIDGTRFERAERRRRGEDHFRVVGACSTFGSH